MRQQHRRRLLLLLCEIHQSSGSLVIRRILARACRASQSKTGRLFFVYASGGTGRHEDHRRQAAYRRRHSPGVTPYSFLNAFENEACDWNPQRPAITSRLVCRSTRSRRAAIAMRSCESQACGVR